jgi:hypothetical protein
MHINHAQRMKKILTIGIIGFSAIAGYYFLLYLSEHGLVNLNKLSVRSTHPLTDGKVKVIQGFFSINRKNDSELFYDWPKHQIIYHGGNSHKPETEYGENDFLVLYDDQYYFQFRHFQTDESEDNSFDFYLIQADTSIYLEVKINDRVKFKRRMNRVSQSQDLLTNMPLDSIRDGVYNGVELK